MLEPPVRQQVGTPRMPAAFGLQPGPRQRPDGSGRWPSDVATTSGMWVALRADGEALSALLTGVALEGEPLLVVEAVALGGLPRLAGRGHHMLTLTVPVRFAGAEADFVGRFELVTWDDRADVTVSGRDELPFNKGWADTLERTTSDDGRTPQFRAAWGGMTFAEVEVHLDDREPSVAAWRLGPVLHHEVVARTGAWGEADVEQVTAGPSTAPALGLESYRRPDCTCAARCS